MMRRTTILWSLVLCAILVACGKDDAPKGSQTTTISFESSIDPTYEWDDNDARAARFSGVDVPRLVLDVADFAGPPNTDNRDTVSLRLNLLALDATNAIRNSRRVRNGTVMGFGLYIFDKQMIRNLNTEPAQVRVTRGDEGYKISFKLHWTDQAGLYPIPGAAWFGQVHIGGAAGYELENQNGWGYLRQYFTNNIPRITEPTAKRTEPNDIIAEVLPNQPIQRRHFPLIGELVPITLFRNDELAANRGKYNDQGHNQGILGDKMEPDYKVVIRPRGTIIAIELSNQTGREIDVVNLQSPLNKGFDFEGYYDTNRCRPFPAGTSGVGLERKTVQELRQMVTPEGQVAPFVAFNSYTADRNQRQYRIFTLRSSRENNSNPLAIGAKSQGRYMLWVNANEPNKPLRLRVNYYDSATASFHNSLPQEILPPQEGFSEGKAYRITLPIKIDPADAPRP